MKKALLWKHLLASVFSFLLISISATSSAQTIYSNGFEISISPGWDAFGGALNPTRVASGTNGITSATGSWHAQFTGSVAVKGNAATNFWAYRTVFPCNGYKTKVDVYLDVNGAWANDTRFDYTSAINNNLGAHRRDFAFNVGFYNDAVAPGSGNRFVISASNSTGRANSFPKNPGRSPQVISSSGWYTFEHSFRNNSGVLACDFTIYDIGQTAVATWTLSDPTDLIGIIGGNRYGWLTSSEFAFLAIDNSSLNLGPTPVHNLTSSLNYCTIQSAINAASANDVISVDAGTYAENVIVNKSLTILGPNNLISPNTGVRVAEAIITGGLTVDNAASKTVNIEGFKFVTVSSPMSYNGNGAGTINANLTFNKNIVNANSGQLVVFTGTATNTATVVVDDNLFQGMASNAMQIGPGAPSHGAVTTTITNNTINTTVNSGINTDGITSSLISANLISNTTQQGIQVAGAAGNVTISQNVITNSNTSGDVNRGGIRLRGGSYTGPVTVINNIVSGSVNGVIVPTGENITGKAITVNNNNLSGNTFGVKNAGTGDLNATCNWYGTANAAVVATKVSGNVTYVPYLSSGTDASPAVVGFQPAAVCAACTLSSVSLGNNRYIFFGIPGLPGASGTLTPIITDGLAPFSYNWSASTDPSVSALTVASVTPTGYTDGQAFDYTVIVTDANGCTATATVNITYFNINCSSNGNNVKVKVCHIPGGNPTNCKTICVSINAYQALLNNGSYLGNCLPNCEVPATRGVVDISNYIVGNQDFKVKVFNNPTETYFRLYVSGDLYEKISIRVSDMYGRVIEQKQNINSDEEIRIGDRYVSGLYIVEVVQGMSKKVIKLVKQ